MTDRADKRNLICAQLFLRKGENKWDKGKEKKTLPSLSGAGETAQGVKCLFCRHEDPGYIALHPDKFISVISGGREEIG